MYLVSIYFMLKCNLVCAIKRVLLKLGVFFYVKIFRIVFIRFIYKVLIIRCENFDWLEFISSDFFSCLVYLGIIFKICFIVI